MILVVDDDQTVLDHAQQILNRERQVFLARDSARALDLAGNLGFSVALVDLDLPGGAGFDLIRTLRRSVPDLQIIAITNAVYSISPRRCQETRSGRSSPETNHSRLEAGGGAHPSTTG